MRNALQQYARYEWRLMVDARLVLLHDDFLQRYLQSGAEEYVRRGDAVAVCGGVEVDGGAQTDVLYRENLRFRYEKTEAAHHSLACRRANPYNPLRTTNIFYHESALRTAPYDERINNYGYEDVMLGRAFEQCGVRMLHIDNPVVYTSFEPNEAYVKKVHEALCTLREFSDELSDYSPLLYVVNRLKFFGLLPLVRLFSRLFTPFLLANLKGRRPSLFLLKIYKVCFYVSLG